MATMHMTEPHAVWPTIKKCLNVFDGPLLLILCMICLVS
jgi:hypothetical protein